VGREGGKGGSACRLGGAAALMARLCGIGLLLRDNDDYLEVRARRRLNPKPHGAARGAS